jgi:NAD(P)-dependent dehydrogenase (short-subunit alcohol dehydrogenase family)
MLNDYRGEAVLITGGTKGIGLATGLAFAAQGARVILTHRWGSADEDELRARFAALDAPEPMIVEADVSHDDDTEQLMDRVKQEHDHIAVFVSNVCAVQPTDGPQSYRKRSLLKSLEYSAWPLVGYLQHIKARFGRVPRYVVGVSSDGAHQYFSHYEYVATSKAVMETLCRYLAYHLRDEDVRINLVSSRNVLTDAVAEIFGDDYEPFMREHAGEAYFMQAEEVAAAIVGLCSGLLDALDGQVIQVDKGMSFADTSMHQLERHRRQKGVPA